MAMQNPSGTGLERQLIAALEEKIDLLSHMLENEDNEAHPMRFAWRAQRRAARDQLAVLQDGDR